MVRARMLPDPAADPLLERRVQHRALAQAHEEHDADIALPLLPNDKALNHLRQLLHLTVDLRGTDPYAPGVESGIAPAGDHQPVVAGQPGPIAMAPHAGKMVEVGRAVLGARGVVPEGD